MGGCGVTSRKCCFYLRILKTLSIEHFITQTLKKKVTNFNKKLHLNKDFFPSMAAGCGNCLHNWFFVAHLATTTSYLVQMFQTEDEEWDLL